MDVCQSLLLESKTALLVSCFEQITPQNEQLKIITNF